MEQILRENEQRFRAIFEHTGDRRCQQAGSPRGECNSALQKTYRHLTTHNLASRARI